MNQKLKITAVSYLNTKPFLYGLLNSPLIDFLDVKLAIPSESARKLLADEVDIGLVPVAILPELGTYHIVSDYCIGSISEVATVCLFSEVPLEEIEEVYLDYHSRTSVLLAQLLFRDYWKQPIKFIAASQGFIAKIGGKTAGVIIGDRAIDVRNKFKYKYDLATAWNDWTRMPFVFAVWVSKQPLDPVVKGIFNSALGSGLQKIEHLIKILPESDSGFDLHNYYTKQISYEFDANKQKALEFYLELVKTI